MGYELSAQKFLNTAGIERGISTRASEGGSVESPSAGKSDSCVVVGFTMEFHSNGLGVGLARVRHCIVQEHLWSLGVLFVGLHLQESQILGIS